MKKLTRQTISLLVQTAAEIKLFWRTGEAVFLTFVTPMLGMALFVYLHREGMLARVYDFLLRGMGGRETGEGSWSLPLVCMTIGMITYCAIAAAFESPTPQLVRQRQAGILKRLGGTPLPAWVLLVAKSVSASTLVAIEVALILVVGLVSTDIPLAAGGLASALPALGSLAVILVLGTLTLSALSFILSSLIASVDAAIVAVHAVYIPMLLLCGAFVPLEALPRALQVIARALPLTYFAGPLRRVVMEGTGLAAMSGDLGILLVWLVAAWLVALKLFRWE